MKVKDIIKKQTTIIAIAVALVAVTAIGVSYAIFFDVKKNSENQVITAGTLKLTVSGVSALNVSEPVDNETGLASTPVSYTVKNTASNLPASYKIYIYADTNNTMDLNKIKISTDGNATKGNTIKTLGTIAQKFTEGSKTYYQIEPELGTGTSTLAAATSSETKYIRVWLDEDSINGEVTAKVDLNMYIVSEVQE